MADFEDNDPPSVIIPPTDKALPRPGMSKTLKPPILPNVRCDAITDLQADTGISVHIPGSAGMRVGDVVVLHWGRDLHAATIDEPVKDDSIVATYCLNYNYMIHIKHGPVNVHFEVYRGQRIIGRSPVLRAYVKNRHRLSEKQRCRRRMMGKKPPKP